MQEKPHLQSLMGTSDAPIQLDRSSEGTDDRAGPASTFVRDRSRIEEREGGCVKYDMASGFGSKGDDMTSEM